VLALPYHGRAIPLAVGILAEGFLENEMTAFEIDLVHRFLGWLFRLSATTGGFDSRLTDPFVQRAPKPALRPILPCSRPLSQGSTHSFRGEPLFPALRSRIVVLADRGFAKTELFQAIEREGAGYVIRLPRDHRVRVQGEWRELRALPIAPGETRTYRQIPHTQEHEHAIGLVVRRLPVGKANDPDDDTWYLATNRPELDRAADWYSLRFRTEELFKDWKSILDAAKHRLHSEEAVAKLVGILGVFYSYVVLEGQIKTPPDRLRQVTQNRKGNPELGIFRQCLAVLLRWAAEIASTPLDRLMPVWVQLHRTRGRTQ
jgi:hypothetical protein